MSQVSSKISAEERHVCDKMGISEKDFLETKADIATEAARRGGPGLASATNREEAALTAEERQVCELMGLSAEEFITTKSSAA